VIWDMIFEQFTEDVKNMIAKDVEEIINYDPRIVVNEVQVDSTDQGIRIEANVTYIPFNINERMTFDFDKENSIIN
jgi:phage baseplate assembly protein W